MAKQPVRQEIKPLVDEAKEPVRHCGVIMPIAAMGDYEAGHWVRVQEVIYAAITEAKFVPRIVSDGDAIGVIHGNIVQNLYDDEIVVCDVSGKNPNVMFELGMRLAFDKPTIVVKDDVTTYSFDTSPIMHIGYRRDQRFDDVEQFKKKVTEAILSTVAKKQADDSFSPFLKYFGTFTAKSVENHEIPQADFIMKKLDQIDARISKIDRHQGTGVTPSAGMSRVATALLAKGNQIDVSDRQLRNEALILLQSYMRAAKANETLDTDRATAIKAVVGRLVDDNNIKTQDAILAVNEAFDIFDLLM